MIVLDCMGCMVRRWNKWLTSHLGVCRVLFSWSSARGIWNAEVAGSNPATPTITKRKERGMVRSEDAKGLKVVIIDDDCIEYQAFVESHWGSTFLHAVSEDDFVMAILAVLPRDASVYVMLDTLDSQRLVDALFNIGYQVYTRRKQPLCEANACNA